MPALLWALGLFEWPLCGLLCGGLYGGAEDHGAVRRMQIFFSHRLNFLTLYSEEAVENRVHELRLVVEQCEAGEEVHQTVTRHAAAAAFQCGEIVGPPLHFE